MLMAIFRRPQTSEPDKSLHRLRPFFMDSPDDRLSRPRDPPVCISFFLVDDLKPNQWQHGIAIGFDLNTRYRGHVIAGLET